MANVIDILVSKQAQAELDKVISSLKVTHEEIIKINQQGLKINSGASPKNPVQMNQSVKETIALTAQLTAEEQKLLVATNRLESLRQKQIQTQIKENALIKSTIDLKNKEARERQKNEQAIAKEEQKLAVAGNYYNKLQTELNNLSFAYKDLASRQQMGANLSRVEAERMAYLEKRIKTLDTTLKGVDGAMGKYSRNVGNYAGSFNPLNNSIAQLGREMPAFANSVQTGFMAISNNLPIFFDAMQNVIAQNKELQAQGKPTKSVLTQLAGALFSFQTLLSVGVTLLTLYGKEIVTWASTLWGASEAMSELEKNQKEFNNSKKQGIKDSISERTEVDKNLRVMRNSNLEAEKRNIALNNLRNQYPLYFKNLTDEQMLNGNITVVMKQLNQALKDRATLNKATELVVKQKDKLEDLKTELELNNNLIRAKRIEKEDALKAQKERSFNYRQDELIANRAISAISSLEEAEKKNLKIQRDINAYNRAIAGNTAVINDLKGKQIELEGRLNDENEKANKIKKKSIELQQEEFTAEANSRDAFQNTISALQAQMDKMSILNPQYKFLEFNLRLVKDAYEALYGEQKKQESVQDPKFGTLEYYEKLKAEIQNQQKTVADNSQEWQAYQRLIEAVNIDIEKLTGSTKKLNETFFDSEAYFKTFVDSFTSQSGFGEVFKVMDLLNQNFKTVEEKAKVVGLAVSEAFQEAFNTISSYSDANYQTMFSNLERQRDVSILFAGESATARAEIDRVYEERRKRIQRQQAESQKRLAMFNIAINTAQGITSALAMLPPNVPLAVTIGIIGAAQLAMTASQPIPQFYKGTQNAPEGLAWTDEKGAELHTDSKGNIKDYGSNKGARLKKLDKGDKIYTASQTKKMMDLYGFNQDFNNIMLTNGISTSNFNNNSVNLEPLNARLDRLTNVVANKSEFTMVNNESGTRYYERVNGQRRELVNSVLTMKPRTIK